MKLAKTILSFVIVLALTLAITFAVACGVLYFTGRDQDFFCVLVFGGIFVAMMLGFFDD